MEKPTKPRKKRIRPFLKRTVAPTTPGLLQTLAARLGVSEGKALDYAVQLAADAPPRAT